MAATIRVSLLVNTTDTISIVVVIIVIIISAPGKHLKDDTILSKVVIFFCSWGAIEVSGVNFKPRLVWLSGLSASLPPRGRPFDSQSGHMPGLRARFQVGDVREATTHGCFSPSLSGSLPLSLKVNKLFITNFKKFKRSDFLSVLC